MSRSAIRTAVIVLTLVTALIHLVVLNILLRSVSIPFTLNGLGFLVLLFVFLTPSILPAQRRLIHYAFMAYTAVTILAWLLQGDPGEILGIITKLVEVLLIVALWQHLKFVD